LLYWPTLALTEAGWDVWSVDWHAEISESTLDDPAHFVEQALFQALPELPSAPTVVIGKSLGTFALPYFVDRDVRAAWLTPILTDPRVGEAAHRATADHLFVGGTADSSWIPRGTLGSYSTIVEMPAANHSLEGTETGWQSSAAAQIDVLDRVVSHLVLAAPRAPRIGCAT
jgi:hypothetical protein